MAHMIAYAGTVFLLLIHTLSATTAAGKIDPSVEGVNGILWYDIRHLDVEGKGWTNTKSFYDRLPAKAEAVVREPVWNLSHNSAGMCVRFITDANEIHARWELQSKSLAMPHMPATSVSSLDLYVKDVDEKWKWLAIGRPTQFPVNSVTLVKDIPEGTREYLLYLPLYNSVLSVEVGVPDESAFRKAAPYSKDHKPIVFYGTSITQGGCASRTGMVHTAILGRWFHYPIINLGLSGNGCMESEMADLLAELDPSVYVLDCLPNMNEQMVSERVAPFVKRLREAHPETPILLVEDRTYSDAFLVISHHQQNMENRRELQRIYSGLKSEGVKHLHYLSGNRLLRDDCDNLATVDGSHPTDLGFMRQADVFYEVLKPILIGNNEPNISEIRASSEPGKVMPQGFTPLFNGINLDGWMVQQPENQDWQVVDGVIDCNPHEGQGDKNLWTTRSYGDFELLVDWRIKESPYINRAAKIILPDGTYKKDNTGKEVLIEVPNTDSGIFLRGQHKSQVNIWCWPIGSGEVWGYRTDPTFSSEVHAGVTPKVKADQPIGQWNTFHIIMKADRLTVMLNGRLVLDNAQLPGVPAQGPIALQHHGDRKDGEWGASFLQFRRIFIKELWSPSGP